MFVTLVIRLRWAATALLLCVAAIIAITWKQPTRWVSGGDGVLIADGRIILANGDLRQPGFDPMSEFLRASDCWWFHRDWLNFSTLCADGIACGVRSLPLWPTALPPFVLAIAGFCAKDRRTAHGTCIVCKYPQRGVAVCPECGTPSVSSANS